MPRPKGTKPKEEKRSVVRHGLYCDPSRICLDGRSFFARKRRKLREGFLADFQTPPSSRILVIADGAAVNWILVENLRTMILRGQTLAGSVLKDYTAISNSLTRDLLTLEQLAKENGSKDKTPSLAEYLAILQKAGQAMPAVIHHFNPQEGGDQ